MKLATPFATNKNAGTQRSIGGSERKRDRMRITAARRSTKESTSPVMRNMLFKSNRPAENNSSCVKGCIPNISIRNAAAAVRSMAPKIFTIIYGFKTCGS